MSRAAGSRRKQLQPTLQKAQSTNFQSIHSPSSRAAFSSRPNELVPIIPDPPAAKPRQTFAPLPDLNSSASIWRHTDNKSPDNLLHRSDHPQPSTYQPHIPLVQDTFPGSSAFHPHPQDEYLPLDQDSMSYGSDNYAQPLSPRRALPPPPPQTRGPTRPPRPTPHETLEVNVPPGPVSPPLPTPSSFSSSSSLSPFLNRIQETTRSNNIYSQSSSHTLSQEFVPMPYQQQLQQQPSPLSNLSSNSYSPPGSSMSSNFPHSRSQNFNPSRNQPHPFHEQPAGPGVRQAGSGRPYANHHVDVFQPFSEPNNPRPANFGAAATPNRSIPHSNHYNTTAPPFQRPYQLRQVTSSSSLNSIDQDHHNHRLYHHQLHNRSFDSASILTNSSGPSREHIPISQNRSNFMSTTSLGRRSEGSIHGSSDGQTQFIYPGGRSRAHPNGAPRFRLRGKKKKDKNRNKGGQTGGDYAGNKQGGGKRDNTKAPSNNDQWGTPSSLFAAQDVQHHHPCNPADLNVPPHTSESSVHFAFSSSHSRSPPTRHQAPVPPRDRKTSQRTVADNLPATTRRESDASGNSWDEIQPPHTRVLGLASKSKQRKEAESSPSSLSPSVSDGCTFTEASPTLCRDDDDAQLSSVGGRDNSSLAVGGRVLQLKNKIGQYPLDPYDSTLLDIDLHTYTLLRKLRPTESSPTFHDYGFQPPNTVLDLGCGQGHWLLDAAIAWKGYGTQITGLDMVDITKTLRPIAIKLGVAENIKFVRGNFLKQGLPFSDGSFDLVRMSCVGLAIPFEKWQPLLLEVSRVLAVGGRLELIDDQVIFPYPPVTSPRNKQSGDSSFELYRLREEDETKDDMSDTDTLNESRLQPSDGSKPPSSGRLLPRGSSAGGSPASSPTDPWHEHAAASRELESLFEHMLNHKYGLHLHPSEFITTVLSNVFEHSREMRNIHLVLAPPDETLATDDPEREEGEESDSIDLLSNCPGVIAWPSSTFIRMKENELEGLVSKHPRILLSCKSALVQYALDVADEDDIDEETILEALWEYEGFIRERFVPPANAIRDESSISTGSMGDSQSIGESIFSMNTLNTISSEGLAAIRDYQADLGEIIDFNSLTVGEEPAWPPSRPNASSTVLKPSSSRTRSGSVTTTGTRVPPYSLIEPCRVRQFHIYEAAKLS